MRPLVRLVVDFLPGVLPVLKGHSDGLAVSEGSSFKKSRCAPASIGEESGHVGCEAAKEAGLGPGRLEFSG